MSFSHQPPLKTSAPTLPQAMDSLPLNRRHGLIFAVCAAGFIFDSFDFQLLAMAAPLLLKEWSLSSVVLGRVFSAMVVGMLIGSLTFGVVADRIGRRAAFQITVAIFGVFSGLAAFAQNVQQLAIIQLLVGVGIGGFVPVDASVISEFMPTRHRGRIVSLWALFYPVGGLLAALSASLVVAEFGWRVLFIIGAVPAVLVVLLRRLIPETPRYLLRAGRGEEARQSYRWLAGRDAVEVEAQTTESEAATPQGSPVKTLLGKPLRARTLMIWTVWFGWSFSYFGILLWLPTLLTKYRGMRLSEVFAYMIGFMICGILGRITMSSVIDKVGRVTMIGLFGLCASVAVLFFGHSTDRVWLFVTGYVFAFFHDGGLSAIASYTPELYPTSARATGYGFAAGVGRVASIISPLIVGYVVNLDVSYVFVVFACGYALAAGAAKFAGIETRGCALEDLPQTSIADLTGRSLPEY